MLEVPWVGISEPRERVNCCRSTELLLSLPTRGGVARLSRPRAIVCKFPGHRNYAVTQVFGTGFELVTVRARIQRATTAPPRHTISLVQLLPIEPVVFLLRF